MSTRERILELALSRFNSEGLAAFGMREIAQELELSPGNVTYYFPKKEDLVRELSERLSTLNDQTLTEIEPKNFGDLLDSLRQGMQNLWDYRFLSASFVQVMKDYPSVAEGYGQTESRRRGGMRDSLRLLQHRGLVAPEASAIELDQIAHAVALIARFGVPDSEVRKVAWGQELPLDHYVTLIARVLMTIASPEAQRELLGLARSC